MLITRPDHDLTTRYLFFWSEQIIAQAEKSKRKIIDLKGKRANKKEFVSVIKRQKSSFVVMNGHGDSESIRGYDDEVLIQAGDNEEVLAGMIVFARSCSSAKKLGPASIKSGTKSFIGYIDDFVFLFNERYLTRPLRDKTAAMFLEPSNQVAISLLKSHSVLEADQYSKKLYQKNIEKLMTSEASSEAKDFLPFLIWDMKHQVCLGDGGAVV